jgi:N-acetylmuramoyl-L-alanine amidase
MSDWDFDRLPAPETGSPRRVGPVGWGYRRERPGYRRESTPSRTSASHARLQAKATPTARTTKPVPRMPKRGGDSRVKSPGITLAGTLLILGLTVLAFAGGRIFGTVEQPPPASQALAAATPPAISAPTVEAERPTVAADQTPIPLPAAFSRPPVVCLDPGHGGPDPGFTRFFEAELPELEEKTLVLEFAWDLEARLKQRGYDVVLTRETDTAVNVEGKDVNGDGRTAAHDAPRSNRNKNLDELQARINVCNDANADLLVSMHVNGYSNGNPRGYETWFTRERPFGDKNAVFATLAYAHLKEQLGNIGYVLPAEEERGVLPDTTADVQKEHSLFRHFIITGPEVPGVVQPSKMPGAIVETLFVSNDGDAAVLATPEGRNAIVNAYENAVVEYFEWYPPEER